MLTTSHMIKKAAGAQPVAGDQTPHKRHFGFLLLPGYSHYALSAALEPLHSANVILGQDHFSWSLIGVEGDQVQASNGVTCLVDQTLNQGSVPDEVIICAGNNIVTLDTRGVEQWLRHCYRQGARLGAISSGVVVLARTGLLDDRKCAAHWEDMPRLREDYPRITVTDSIFELDHRLITCAGGAAGTHMMLALIEADVGVGIVVDVATRMVLDRVRDGHDTLNVLPHIRYGTWNRSVLNAIEVMNANISEPLKMQMVSADTGVSVRQLERLFKTAMGMTPHKFYRHIRLSRARQLLLYSDHSLVEIAAICGFGTTQVLKKSYECVYDVSPREERRKRQHFSTPAGCSYTAPMVHELSAQY